MKGMSVLTRMDFVASGGVVLAAFRKKRVSKPERILLRPFSDVYKVDKQRHNDDESDDACHHCPCYHARVGRFLSTCT